MESLGFEPWTFGFGIGHVTTRLTCLPLVADKITKYKMLSRCSSRAPVR